MNGHAPARFPAHLKSFIANADWTFAKTMSDWPHHYIVRSRVDGFLFVQLVEHIRRFGYEGRFYSKPITYFDEDGFVYWTMGSPIAETTIVNRARKEDSYEYRLEHDTLPGREAD
ncbi:MAG: hypothetical protein M0P16_11750 [Syntrophales bacterium]|nr:hypothetical protein [Syntrophales bacterium]